jgi:glycosyltransferase involved in cell wall biosynthesis
MKFLFLVRKKAYAFCDKLVALSEEDKAEQIALGLADAKNFTIVMNGIGDEFFTDPPERAVSEFKQRFSTGENTIGTVGRLSSEKGQDILINAFALLVKQKPDLKLLIVGDGDDRNKLEAQANALKLKEKIIFIGNLSDVRSALKTMKVFVLPSRYESQGLAAMEAMAMGIPPVASNIAGIPALFSNGHEGFLAEAENAEIFAGKILELLDNPDLMVKMGRNARKKALEKFSAARMTAEYAKLYLES